MLPRMAFGLGMAFGLALAGPGLAVVGGQPSAQQSQQLGSQEERINRRQALDIEVQREDRDQAERTELIRRLVAVAGLSAEAPCVRARTVAFPGRHTTALYPGYPAMVHDRKRRRRTCLILSGPLQARKVSPVPITVSSLSPRPSWSDPSGDRLSMLGATMPRPSSHRHLDRRPDHPATALTDRPCREPLGSRSVERERTGWAAPAERPCRIRARPDTGWTGNA